MIPALDVRRRGAEQQQRLVLSTAELGDVARVIARGVLGLIAVLLLFVDDDNAQLLRGREHGAARANDDAGLAVFYPPPLVQALARREA